MDVLVSLGTNASYVYSMISILHHHIMRHHISGAYKPTDFFETSAMLISFILLGKYLEAAAKSRTSAAITRLLQLTPPTAILLTLDAKGNVATEQELPTGLVHRGDLLKVSHECDNQDTDTTDILGYGLCLSLFASASMLCRLVL